MENELVQKRASLIQEQQATAEQIEVLTSRFEDLRRRLDAIDLVLEMLRPQHNDNHPVSQQGGDTAADTNGENGHAQLGVIDAVRAVVNTMTSDFDLPEVEHELRHAFPGRGFNQSTVSGALRRLCERNILELVGERGHGRRPSKYRRRAADAAAL